MNESILDKTPKPPGLLPKHVQSWLIVGLAVLMILIMWLTGGRKPQVTPRPGAPLGVSPPLVEVNEGKIAELQNRIQELQREQLVAQNALTQQSRVLTAGAEGPAANDNAATATDAEHVKDPIQAEREKRGYLSLFASNIALTYRRNPAVFPPTGAEPTPHEFRVGNFRCSPCSKRSGIPHAIFQNDAAAPQFRGLPACRPYSSFSSERHREFRELRPGAEGGDPPCGRLWRSELGHRDLVRSF